MPTLTWVSSCELARGRSFTARSGGRGWRTCTGVSDARNLGVLPASPLRIWTRPVRTAVQAPARAEMRGKSLLELGPLGGGRRRLAMRRRHKPPRQRSAIPVGQRKSQLVRLGTGRGRRLPERTESHSFTIGDPEVDRVGWGFAARLLEHRMDPVGQRPHHPATCPRCR